jgi:hypothetical protein
LLTSNSLIQLFPDLTEIPENVEYVFLLKHFPHEYLLLPLYLDLSHGRVQLISKTVGKFRLSATSPFLIFIFKIYN